MGGMILNVFQAVSVPVIAYAKHVTQWHSDGVCCLGTKQFGTPTQKKKKIQICLSFTHTF